MENTFKEYERFLQVRTRLAPRTIKGNMEYVRRLENMAATESQHLTQLNTTWFEDNLILSKSLSENTKRLYLLAAKRFFNWLKGIGRAAVNPIDGLPIPHNCRSNKHRALTVEQIQQISDCCDPREQVLLFFLYVTGIRQDELCKLDREDIDFKKKVIWIRHGKGDKMRFIPFNPEKLLPVWERYVRIYKLNDKPQALCNQKGGRLTKAGVILFYRKMKDLTGIEFTTHDLRYSFATSEMDAGISQYALQKVMGHSDWRTTLGYIQGSTKPIVDEMLKIDISKNISLDSLLTFC